MLLFLMGTQARFLLKSLVAPLEIALIRRLVHLEIDMLLEILVLGKPSAANFADIAFEIHMCDNQMAPQTKSRAELLVAVIQGADEWPIAVLALHNLPDNKG